jgi:hypothetical protein
MPPDARTDPPVPLKMISHNGLRTEAEGGETAFMRAREMGISIVRFDFRYHQLATPGGGWLWDTDESNRWTDLLEPSLRWTKEHGMRTLVNLLAYKVPAHSMAPLNEAWKAHRGKRRLRDRDTALWAAWAAGNGIDVGAPTPKDYTEALIDRLAEGQERGEWDIAGFCVLNEPNTRWPAEPNWRRLKIPEGPRSYTTYTTANFCSDLCDWVSGHIDRRYRDAMGHNARWREVAANPNLDVLGIDIYWDQLWGLFARGRPEAMGDLSREHGKDWWLVETAGADGPGWFTNPSCHWVREYSDRCRATGARVLGYYRLWGDYGWPWNFSKGYNIFTDPGNSPTASTDGRGDRYWETIRDI